MSDHVREPIDNDEDVLAMKRGDMPFLREKENEGWSTKSVMVGQKDGLRIPGLPLNLMRSRDGAILPRPPRRSQQGRANIEPHLNNHAILTRDRVARAACFGFWPIV